MGSQATVTKNNSKLKKNSSSGSSRFLLCCSCGPPKIAFMEGNEGQVGSGRKLEDVLSEPGGLKNDVGEKQDTMANHGTNVPSDSLSDEGSEDKDENGGAKKKKKGRRKLFGIMKAVLFETSLAKKMRRKKNRIKGDQLTKSKNSSDESYSMHEEFFDFETETKLSHAYYPSFRSCFTVPSVSERSSKPSFHENKLGGQKAIEDKIQKLRDLQEHKKWCYSSKINFCLIFISLLVLVLWGKVCAIVCTSAWLYFVPYWNVYNRNKMKHVIDSPEFDSKDYKNQILTEGLLEIDHSRVS